MSWRRLLVAVVAALGLFLVAGLWRSVGQLPSTPPATEWPGAYPIPSAIEAPAALPTPSGPYPPPLGTLAPYPVITPTAMPARVSTLAPPVMATPTRAATIALPTPIPTATRTPRPAAPSTN